MIRTACAGILAALAVCLVVAGCGSRGSGQVADAAAEAAGDALGEAGKDATAEQGGGPDTLGTECQGQSRKCEGADAAYLCQGGWWVLQQKCGQLQVCWEGACLEAAQCEPGATGGCYSQTAWKQCSPQGHAWVPVECAGGEFCIQGACVPAECFPGLGECVDGGTLRTCGPDGSWGVPQPCPDGLSCLGGGCVSECQKDLKWANSSIGCEYWTLDLDMSDKATIGTGDPDPASSPHSVVLSNPGDTAAVVSFKTHAAGITLPYTQEIIEAGQTREFEMPRMDLEGAGIFDRSVRILSNRPLVAVQFNPKDMVNAHSNDSSLLLPAEMMGKEYYILAWPSQMEIAVSVYPALLGYFTMVAVEPGETHVTVTLASEGKPVVPGGAALPAGTPLSFSLQQFQVLQLEGVSKTLNLENDMSGSHVVADKRISVFAGHEGPLICPEASHVLCPVQIDPPPGASECSCCLDHLEEQLWPVSAWSSEYLVVKAAPRGPVDLDTYRVQAGAGGVTLHTQPAVAGLDGKVLAQAGDWLQVETDQSFLLTASGPIQVAQYLSAMECVSDYTGDPSMTMIAGRSQYRDNYPILVPQGYESNWLAVVRPAGSATSLDLAPVNHAFLPLGSTGWEFAYLELDAGPHYVQGTAPFGATQYGFFEATCYANPAGMNLAPAPGRGR
jgi:hypothetical protein